MTFSFPVFFRKIFLEFKSELRSYFLVRKILFLTILVMFSVVCFSTMGLSGRPLFNKVNIGFNVVLAFFCLLYCFLYGSFSIGVYVILIVLFNFVTLISYALNGFSTFSSTALTVGIVSIAFFQFLNNSPFNKKTALFFSELGVLGFLAYFFVVYFHDIIHPSISSSSRIGTYFGNQNDVGRYLSFALLYTFYFAFFKKMYFLYLPVVLAFYFIVLTGSISNLLTVYFVLAAFFLIFLKKKGRLLFVLGNVLIVIIILFALQLPALSYFKTRLLSMASSLFGNDNSVEDSSFEHRFELAFEAFYLFFQKPLFGGGFGAVQADSFVHTFAHNNYAELCADFGIFGLIFGEAILFYPLMKGRGKTDDLHFFTFLVCIYIVFFQIFLVSYYSKMEYFSLAFAFAGLTNSVGFEFSPRQGTSTTKLIISAK